MSGFDILSACGGVLHQTDLSNPDVSLGVNLGWPEGFFTETAGALADDESFFCPPQGDYELREDLNVPT